jgi:GT2 family glycosyltransferase
MQRSKELSIIIVNYRSEQYLKNCVASLFRSLKNINFEIIVVNNDENILDVETHCNASLRTDVNIQIINQQKNIGFGAANNLGAKEAQGEYLWLLNPDTELLGEDVRPILTELKSQEKVAIIGPRLVLESGETQEWCAGSEASFWDLMRNNLGFPKSQKIWESRTAIEAAWVSGGAMIVRQADFQAIGGFDEKFFLYYEDIDLCQRMREQGKIVCYQPKIEVLHRGGGSVLDKTQQKTDYYQAQDYYFTKHAGARTAGFVKVLRKIFV